MHPGLDVRGEQGLALRCPMVLRAAGPEDYAWNPATDQRDLAEGEDVPGFVPDLAMPGVITAVSGSAAALGSGGSATPRIRFSFDPADSERVGSYSWEYRIVGRTWADGGRIDARVRDGSGKVFGYLHPVLVGEVYDVAVWSRADGDESERRVYSGVVALAADVVLEPPVIVAAVGGTAQITLTIRTPNSFYIRALRVYASASTDPLTAVEITVDPIAATPNWTFNYVDSGLTAGATWHYWTRIEGPYGALSELSARVPATAT
ncbi:hypothetical protein CNY89_09435 [Amaricoccus sp. HAR-UPW-R2A-40]|nr:hypothetical protein CNY89_09435 [Amaricoccus sp. HAR-UPW-R2A-40]